MGAHACQCPLRKPTGQRNAKAVCKRNENRRSMATRSRAFWLTQGSVVWNVEADRNELFNGTSRTPARARLRQSLSGAASGQPAMRSQARQRDSTDRAYLIYFVLSRNLLRWESVASCAGRPAQWRH
jgi:hypothetical protein